MKSAVLTRPHQMEIQETPIPDIGSGDVLVKVMACGVCGTDVHIFDGDKGAADNPLPIVLGHEFAGIVETTGTDAGDIHVGDRVCVDPNVLCGRCYFCKSGIGHFCTAMTGIGTTVDGGFAQYCAVPWQQVYPLADGIDFATGAMAEPLACCVHGIDLCGIRTGSHVVVFGGGMIGLLMVQLARMQGASVVVLVEPVANKRETGLALGADVALDPFREDVKLALDNLHLTQVDVVIECVGSPGTISQAIDIVGRHGTVMMFGLTKPDEEIPLKPFEMFRKEIVLKASYINPYTIGRAVDLINRGRIHVDSIITSPVPLDSLGQVLASPSLRQHGKVLIDPWL